MQQKTGLIGFGNVGQHMAHAFDIEPECIIDPAYDMEGENLPICDIVFICVPTPLIEEGPLKGILSTTAVTEAVSQLGPHQIGVVKSTVNPGDMSMLCRGHEGPLVYNPEFYGMSPGHPYQGSISHIVLGGHPHYCQHVLERYWTIINSNINVRMMTYEEAEIVKLTENRAVMFKVMQCQELYDACQRADINYYKIRDAVYGDDPRFNLWFTAIYPDARGCNSPCIPKDVIAWATWAGAEFGLTGSMIAFNQEKYLAK